MKWIENYKKAITFSYDDGVEQDRRLSALFAEYGVRATFNLNSGMDRNTGTWNCKGLEVHRLNPEQWKEIYAGQETAVHTLHHPNLCETADETFIRKEIRDDKAGIEKAMGQTVWGMAYPYGAYTDMVKKIALEEGIRYSRTTKSSYGFDLSDDLLELAPTCHHNDDALFELADEFLRKDFHEPKVFYVWGHSYEFDVHDNWHRIEDLLKKIAGRKDIFYGTNAQILLDK